MRSEASFRLTGGNDAGRRLPNEPTKSTTTAAPTVPVVRRKTNHFPLARVARVDASLDRRRRNGLGRTGGRRGADLRRPAAGGTPAAVGPRVDLAGHGGRRRRAVCRRAD